MSDFIKNIVKLAKEYRAYCSDARFSIATPMKNIALPIYPNLTEEGYIQIPVDMENQQIYVAMIQQAVNEIIKQTHTQENKVFSKYINYIKDCCKKGKYSFFQILEAFDTAIQHYNKRYPSNPIQMRLNQRTKKIDVADKVMAKIMQHLFPHVNPNFIVDDNMGKNYDGYYRVKDKIKTYDVKTKKQPRKPQKTWQVSAIKPMVQTYESLIFCAYDKNSLQSNTILFYIVGAMDAKQFFQDANFRKINSKLGNGQYTRWGDYFVKIYQLKSPERMFSTKTESHQ